MIGMLAEAAFIFMKIILKKQNSVLRTTGREQAVSSGWVKTTSLWVQSGPQVLLQGPLGRRGSDDSWNWHMGV